MAQAYKPQVIHLIDDTTAGGVMRVLDHLTQSQDLAQDADHRIMQVKRGQVSARRITADVIVSHLSISWRTLPALAALRARHPFSRIIHVEHSYTAGFVQHNVTHQRRFFCLLRCAFRLFDTVVAVSKGQADWLTGQQLVSPDKLSVIRSYVDLSPFAGLPPRIGPITHFGAIGRLDRQKGFDTLITAFRQVKGLDLRLSIFGDGPESANLRALADGDPRIIFEGFAATPTAPYAKVDAVLMPSRWEAYGLVAIEALAAGRRLVASNIDGLQDHRAIGADLLNGADVTDWAQKIANLARDTGQVATRDVGAIRGSENRQDWQWLLAQHHVLPERQDTFPTMVDTKNLS
ncbi:glycosyltransferase family 4 protein [Yoonia sp. SS1-5]|uniref:Glycosyltransferase family 4 protein n=1 Tax=Yoonia rhodophyticola TaxID=3137370 RepID=A0AAN0MBJ2_9RHOB